MRMYKSLAILTLSPTVCLPIVTALAFFACSSAIFASEPASLHPNSLIRVHLRAPEIGRVAHATPLKEPETGAAAHPNLIQGRLLDITAQDLSLVSGEAEQPTVVPLDDVELVELNVPQGRHLRGAAIGAGVGAAVGLLYALQRGEEDHSDCIVTEGWHLIPDEVGDVTVTVGGALLGAVVGALVAPDTKWRPVPLDQVHLSVAPAPPAETRLGVTLRF